MVYRIRRNSYLTRLPKLYKKQIPFLVVEHWFHKLCYLWFFQYIEQLFHVQFDLGTQTIQNNGKRFHEYDLHFQWIRMNLKKALKHQPYHMDQSFYKNERLKPFLRMIVPRRSSSESTWFWFSSMTRTSIAVRSPVRFDSTILKLTWTNYFFT